MISSKAIELLKTFSEDELRKFGLFVSSPYFNKETVQIKFYELLKKYYPAFGNRNFTKEKMFTKLYPHKKYNDGIMRNILSGMLELAQNFLAVEHSQKREFDFNLGIMEELSLRKQQKLHERQEKKTETILEKETRDETYYYNKALFISRRRNNAIRQKSVLYQHDDALTEITENTMRSFLISALRSCTYMANSNMKLFKADKNSYIVSDSLEAYIESEAENYKDMPYFTYFYNAFKLARTGDEKYFYSLKNIPDEIYSELSEREKNDLFTVLTNYCYQKINNGELKFRTEQFLLHKEQITRGHHKNYGKSFSHIKYMSVVVTGLEAGETVWIEEFMEKYKAELDDTNRENTYNFCRALVYYHQKQYDEALTWAAEVRTEDVSYKHQLKSLYLKIYYDLNDTEPFYSHVDSYRHFLMNQKHIPADTKDIIGSYINFTKKLFDIKNRVEERDFNLMKLRRDVNENKSMINRHWLLERITEIEKTEGIS